MNKVAAKAPPITAPKNLEIMVKKVCYTIEDGGAGLLL